MEPPQSSAAPGSALRLKLLRVTYSSLSFGAAAAKDTKDPAHI